MAYLEREGIGERRVELVRDRTTIGRFEDNDISLSGDMRASRHHAEIEKRDSGEWLVRDLRSRNGTYVNGRRIVESVLKSGDVLRVGGQTFSFTAEQDRFSTIADTSLSALNPLSEISEQERQVISLVGQGLTDQQIARELTISAGTLRDHLDRIREKTGCSRGPELTRLAVRLGLQRDGAAGGATGTRNLTVLFTDIVDSTALASALPPDAADELRRRHFQTLRRTIADSVGTVVKNLGDGLMAVFTSSSEAIGCAVAMQQAVSLDKATERPLGLRIGISAGDVVAEDDDYFGDPVVEAARLCARAEAGQILATSLVRANAGRRAEHHSFVSLGALTLKGLPKSVETFVVAWMPVEPPRPEDAAIGRQPRNRQ